MATHWGINGQPNGWSPRAFGAWLLPGIMVFMCFVFSAVPKTQFRVAFGFIATAVLTFQAVIQWAMLSVAQGHAVDITTVTYVGLGLLFSFVGLALPKATGFLMVASGALTIVAALTAPPSVAFTVFVVSSIIASLGSVLFSLYWRQR
jgi:hypothetical protein